MIKYFCDVCDGPAGAPSRRIDELRRTEGDNSIGLDVVLTVNGVVSPEQHVCDDCVAELLLTAARRYDNAPVIVRQKTVLDGSVDYAKLKQRIEARELALVKREKETDKIAHDARTIAAAAKKRGEEDAAKIALLEAKIIALDAGVEDRIRREVATRDQARIDARDNAEAVAAVARREAIRASAR